MAARKYPSNFKVRIAFFVMLFLLTLAFAALIWVTYEEQRIIAINNKVEATIYDWLSTGTDGGTFELLYEYIHEDGTRYHGSAASFVKTRKEAEAMFGKKVEIYIDGQGDSVVAKVRPQPLLAISITAGLFLIDVVYLVFLIIIPCKKVRKEEVADEEQIEERADSDGEIVG